METGPLDDYTTKYLELNKRFKTAGAVYMQRINGAVDYNPFTAKSQGICLPGDLKEIIAEFKRLTNPEETGTECEILDGIEGRIRFVENKYLPKTE